MINQTIFSNYHRFGSSATMIFDEAQNGRTTPEGSQEKPATGGGKDRSGYSRSQRTE